MGCVNDKQLKRQRKQTKQKFHHSKFTNSNNPMIKMAKQWNIQQLTQRWQTNQMQVIKHRLGQNSWYVSFKQFLELLPHLSTFSQNLKTIQKDFYSLFNYQQDKQLNIQNFFFTQIVFLKSDDYDQLADMIYFVYSSADDKSLMLGSDFRLFQKQFKEYQLNFQLQKKKPQQNEKRQVENVSKKLFRQIFQQYDIKEIRQLFKFNLLQEERKFQGYLQMNGINRQKNKNVYLIDIHWFLKWKSYFQYKHGIQIQLKQKNKKIDNLKTLKIDSYMKQNRKLLSQSQNMARQHETTFSQPINNNFIKGQQQNQLKQNLIEYQDFISVPDQIWAYFQLLYGGGPKISKPYLCYYNKRLVLVKLDKNETKFTENFVKTLFYKPYQTFQQIFQQKKMKTHKKNLLQFQNAQNYFLFYKPLGKIDWVKIQNLSQKIQSFPFHYKTFLVFVPKNRQSDFVDNYNITKTKDNKNQIKQRIKNYGAILNFQHDGILQQGHVGNFYQSTVNMYVKNQKSGYTKQPTTYKQLQKLNPSILQDNNMQGLAGLQNLGNTCFMNSPIQCLLRTPYFGDYLESLDISGKRQQTITYQLQKIYFQGKQSRQCIDMSPFKKKFDQLFPFFEGTAQHDAQQFLMLLLDKLSAQKPQKSSLRISSQIIPSQKQNILKINNYNIMNFFSGTLQTQTICVKCKNKRSSQQNFFTYSVSLPIIKQTMFTYYYIDSSFKVWKYSLTVDKQTQIGDIIKKIVNQLKIVENNLFIVSTFENQWLNNILKLDLNHNISSLQNYDTHLVCYKVQQIQSPQFDDFYEKSTNKTVKLQIRNRKYNQKSKQFKCFYYPFFLEINQKSTGKQLLESLKQNLQKFINQEEVKRHQQSVNKQQFNPKILKSDALSNTFGTNFLKSSSYIFNNELLPFKVKFIRNEDTNKNAICWFCRRLIPTYREKFDEEQHCKGCIFESQNRIFQVKQFIRNWQNLLIVVDWMGEQLTKDFKEQETKSCGQAERLQRQRRSNVEKLLKETSLEEETIELNCEKSKNCNSITAIRKQHIKQPPNVLILHLKRFSFSNNTYTKLKNKIDVSQTFILPGTSAKYILYGNVVHYGSGHGRGGHYINYVKINDKWYKCDDQKVVMTKQGNEHLNSEAYLLFYRKQGLEKSLDYLSF